MKLMILYAFENRPTLIQKQFIMKKNYSFLFLILAAFLMSMSGRQNWIIDPISITNHEDIISGKSFAIGPDQTIHVVFERILPGGFIGIGPSEVYYTSKSPGKAWSTPELISPYDVDCPHPTIAVTPQGDVYVCFLQMEEIDYEMFITIVVAKKNQEQWTYHNLNSPDDLQRKEPMMISDQNGYLHIVYNAMDDDWVTNVCYATNASGEWTEHLIQGTQNWNWNAPDLCISDDGIIHIVYIDADDKVGYVNNTSPGSDNWQTMMIPTGKEFNDYAMVYYHNNVLHVVAGGWDDFEEPMNIYYINYSEEEWSDAVQISDLYPGLPLSMTFDQHGKLFVTGFHAYYGGSFGTLMLIEYSEEGPIETLVEETNSKMILGANITFDSTGNLLILFNEEVDHKNSNIYLFTKEAPKYTLSFSVYNQQGEPIENAQISVDENINPEGDYVFEGLTPGTYNYNITAEGYYILEGHIEITDQDENLVVEMTKDNTSNNFPGNETITVFPNPSKDFIKIQSANNLEIVRIYDISGRQLTEIYPGNYSALIMVNDLNQGIYLLQVQTSKQTFTKKLTISR
jgi:hypothetical protein